MSESGKLYLLNKYGASVPRYTSYPTAPHFRHEPPDSYVDYLLGNQPRDKPVSLYFHIPFCRQLCHYCGCLTKVVNHDQPIKDYLKLLLREIELVGERIGYTAPVSHIHFGGGTPNILSPEDLENLLATVQRYFTLTDDLEIAMEIDPRLLSEQKINGYAALGLSRASLGVQDFQEKVQRAINRIQPYSSIERCTDWLRTAGVKSINFDLIYGLPLQTLEGIADNIDKTVRLQPDRIALFGYAHVPWMRPHQKLLEKYETPGMEERFDQQQQAAHLLVENGYHAVGMDHFALPRDSLSEAARKRTLKRNFQGYTTDQADTIIGFGLSSISNYPQAYIQNTSDITAYRARIRDGALPFAKGCVLSREDLMRRELINTLMCYFEADSTAICSKYDMNPDILKDGFAALDGLAADGLVALEGGHITVTEKGRPFVRVVCACFDAYIAENQGVARHAKAI